jgi:hypothetical protein
MRLRLLSVLSDLSALDSRPFSEEDASTEVGVPGILTRYHQILMPSLKLCATVLHTMGHDNISSVNEVIILSFLGQNNVLEQPSQTVSLHF